MKDKITTPNRDSLIAVVVEHLGIDPAYCADKSSYFKAAAVHKTPDSKRAKNALTAAMPYLTELLRLVGEEDLYRRRKRT